MEQDLEYLNYLSPYVRRAWDGNMLPGWSLKERVIFDYEIVYMMEGEGIVTINRIDYTATPGDLFIFKPGVAHSIQASDKTSMRQPHVHFDLLYDNSSRQVGVCYRPMHKIYPEEKVFFRSDVEMLEILRFPDKISLKNRESVEKIIFELINTMEQNDNYTFLRSKALMIQLIVRVMEEIHGNKSNTAVIPHMVYEKVNVVKEYILLHYRSSITLDQLAALSGISKNHLIRNFKKAFGITPMRYLILTRVERAKQLINESHNSISEIARYVGFSDVQYFSRTFKKCTGVSSSSFKRKSS